MSLPNYKNLLNFAYYYYQNHKQSIDSTYIEKLTNYCKDYEVISFNIFGTLLTKLFECRIDLFAYVENQLFNDGIFAYNFARNRFLAEEEIREIVYKNEQRDEVTLNEIYDHMSKSRDGYNDFLKIAKELELKAELESNISIDDNKILITKLIQTGKKIIFVSDSYLPKNLIENILQKNNLNIYDELYISSDLMDTKQKGSIWLHTLKTNTNFKILHIGNDLQADIQLPKIFNINTYHYSRFLDECRFGAQLDPNLVPFSIMNKIFQIDSGLFSLKKLDENMFWDGLGQTFGAMMLQSFIIWLSENVKKNKINHIYFCARDAQFIKKIWNIYNYDNECNTTSSYLYLSRKSLRIPNYYLELKTRGYLSDSSLTFIVNDSKIDGDTYLSYFNRIGIKESDIDKTCFNSKFGSINNIFEYEKINDIKYFINQNLTDKLLTIYQKEYENAIEYYKQEGLFNGDKELAIVDLGWNGTLQHVLTEFRRQQKVENKIFGFYYGLHNDTAPGRLYNNGPMKSAFFNMYLGFEDDILTRNTISLLENLHFADHGTTKHYKKNELNNKYEPVMEEDHNDLFTEQYQNKIKLFNEGALKTILKWKNKLPVYGITEDWITTESAKAAILQICISPNQYEQKYLGSLKHSALFDHSFYFPLIDPNIPETEEELDKLIHLGAWPCGVFLNLKRRVDEIKPELYCRAKNTFNLYPSLIKKFLFK